MDEIYFSLDDARQELARRANDHGLRKRVEETLGEYLMKEFKEGPRGVVFRQLCSPDNGLLFFYQCAKYIGSEPLVIEYHDDIFVHFNEEKKGLGRLRLCTSEGDRVMVDIMDFHANEKKPLNSALVKSGESLVDFHHTLFEILGYNELTVTNKSEWFKKIGKAKEYYYFFLLHFVAHGVLFETFIEDEEDAEGAFTREIIKPALQRISEEMGLRPLIVRVYPEDQSSAEDFYWWSYPPAVNRYLLEYTAAHGLLQKPVKI